MKNFRFGKSKDKKRISEKKMNYGEMEHDFNKPADFNKESFGEINYDPTLGWIDIKYYGRDSELSFNNLFSTNHLNRKDGLPGSR